MGDGMEEVGLNWEHVWEADPRKRVLREGVELVRQNTGYGPRKIRSRQSASGVGH